MSRIIIICECCKTNEVHKNKGQKKFCKNCGRYIRAEQRRNYNLGASKERAKQNGNRQL